MEMKIYNQGGVLKATVSPADSSTHTHELMGENVVSVTFAYPEYMTLDVNDYIELEGVRYTLRSACEPVQKSTLEYTYNVKFYGREGDAARVRMLHLTDGEYETKFSLDGSPAEHLTKVIGNLNRIGGGNWVMGQTVEAPNQTIEYSNVSCAEALSKIAEAFDTEWWVESNTLTGDSTLNLCRCEVGEEVELGYLQGLTELTRADNDTVPFFTRLIPLGGTRNIDRSKYGHTRLQLPGGVKYVERNMHYGLYEAVEEEAFSGIYPHKVATVSSVDSKTQHGENGDFTVYYFKSADLGFDPKEYEIGGLVMHVVFQGGELNGRDFEVNYNATTTEFEIVNEYPSENIQIPGGHLIPKPSDPFILYNIKMPEEYITEAEEEFRQAVDEYLARYSVDNAIYRGSTDYVYMERQSIDLRVGRRVRLLSDEYFKETGYRESRITRITRNLTSLGRATIECANAVGKGRMAAIESDVSDMKTVIAGRLDEAVLTILRSWDSGNLTDANVLSSLRTVREIQRRALRKDEPDSTEHLLSLFGGLITDNIESQSFSKGPLGSGFTLQQDSEGHSYAEVDELFVRMKAVFRELVIEKLSHVGGEIVLSPARMKCVKVEDRGKAYRCYFDSKDGEREIRNEFAVDDLARCQTFNIKEGTYQNASNQFYWRLVKEVGSDYIDLSKEENEYAENSDIPQAGDEIVQLGNRTNDKRQNAIVMSAYAEDAPSYKQYSGINDFKLTKDMEVTKLSPKGNVITGTFHIDKATGWENIEGLDPAIQEVKDNISSLEYGKGNLLRNSGFTGDYLSAKLSEDVPLNSPLEMYSPSLEYWEVANAFARESSASESKREVELIKGSMSQTLYFRLLAEENYIFSFRGKGGTLTYSCGGYTETVTLTSDWKRYVCKFKTIETDTVFSISGTAVICELQFERGIVPSAWGPAMMDNTSELAYFQSLQYMASAIREASTDILGGLILTNQLHLGNYVDGVMKEVTSGVSGTYTGGDDVAFWAGGDYTQAMDTVMKYMNDPTYMPDETVLAKMANFVVTHGGRAILNDVIVRGYIYALGGVFKGTVEANQGKIGGWEITDNAIVSEEFSGITPSSPGQGPIPYKNKTQLNRDGTISGNLLNISYMSGFIKSYHYGRNFFEWDNNQLRLNTITRTPFSPSDGRSTNVGSPDINSSLVTELEFWGNSNHHVCPIGNASEINGYTYYSLPNDLKYDGVTLRIHNDKYYGSADNSWKQHPIYLVYWKTTSGKPSGSDTINNRTLKSFRGNFTGTKLPLLCGGMVVLTAVAELGDTSTSANKAEELTWFVEMK